MLRLKSFSFMSERKLLIITLITFFLSLLITTNASAAGKIAFSSDRDGNYEIYVMNTDGSGQTRLTVNTAYDWNPAWSPDGLKIAFESIRDGNFEIYVMNKELK